MREFYKKHQELLNEIFRFLLVGGLATLVDFGAYELFRFILLKQMSDPLNLILATSIGFIIGNIINYIFGKEILWIYCGKE